MSNKLTIFYDTLINLCGIKIGNYGRLVYPDVDEPIPLVFDGRPIVFPDKQYLDLNDNRDNDIIIFHPLSESSLPTRGISEVQEVMRRAAIIRTNAVGRFLLSKAVEINRRATADSSFKLDHKLSKLFSKITKVDEDFVKFWTKIDNKMSEDSRYRLFNVSIQPFGNIANKSYDRKAVISSPLYDLLLLGGGDDGKIFDVPIKRKMDVATLKEILLALFPELADGGYQSGSSSDVAPALVAFIQLMTGVSAHFNSLLITYGKEANGSEGMHTSGLEVDLDKNTLTSLRHALPLQEYNEGVGKDDQAKLAEGRTTSRRNAAAKEPIDKRSVRESDIEDKTETPSSVKETKSVTQPSPAAMFSSMTTGGRIYHDAPIDPIAKRDERTREQDDEERSDRESKKPWWSRDERGRNRDDDRDDRGYRSRSRYRDDDDDDDDYDRRGRGRTRQRSRYRDDDRDYDRDRDYRSSRRDTDRREVRGSSSANTSFWARG